MSVPERPPPPIVGKVTHHSVELYWEEALTKQNETAKKAKGDSRTRVVLQELDQTGTWGTVYTGYAKRNIVDSLDPWTQFTYRICFKNDKGQSEFSQSLPVWTTKEPLTGEHLHKAIILQDIGQLQKVLEAKEANVDTPDKYGYTPLMQAAQKGYLDMMELLIKNDADVNQQNEAGKTALMLSAFAGKTNICKELRAHGANYKVQDRGGSTALHWAMHSENAELIQYMIDDGADIHQTDCNGWTPLLRLASTNGNKQLASLLIRNGAAINQRDKDGKTVLMMAVINGHQGLVEELLSKNADLSAQNEYGKTAYEMARSMEKRRVCRTIEEYMESKGLIKQY